MAEAIDVVERAPGRFVVTVGTGPAATTHEVGVDPAYVRRVAGEGVAAADLVRASFAFLLEREPKEAILARFDLPVIARYFPEYEREIRRRVGR
jgi:hypothetical protein